MFLPAHRYRSKDVKITLTDKTLKANGYLHMAVDPAKSPVPVPLIATILRGRVPRPTALDVIIRARCDPMLLFYTYDPHQPLDWGVR